MSNNIELFIKNVINELEERGYEIENFKTENDHVLVTMRRFGMKMQMTFNPKDYGFV